MTYLIRPMKEKDIDQIMGIESVSFGTHHWSKQSFRSELRNKTGSYYVLCDGDAEKVIGYSGFWLIMDESHITTIAIHPDYRRKNLGELLLQNLIEKSIMRKAKWITLEVRTSNIGAQNLYYKYGFSSLGVRRKYYQDNDEDALIMWTEDIHSMKFKELFQQNVEELKPKLDSEYKFVKG